MEKKILIPIDFTEINKAMLRIADEWAQRTGATLYILHAVPDLSYRFIEPRVENVFHTHDGELIELLKQRIEKFVQAMNLQSPHENMVREGKPYLEILAVQQEIGADLIIIGAHDHTVVGRVFLGSNTDYILHHGHCPTYVYREPLSMTA